MNLNNKSIKTSIKRKIGLLLGHFKYFNTKVFFPRNSLIFRMACEEGIYDLDVLRFIFTYLEEDGLFIDVGTNIGLLSIPILNNFSRTKVLSFEPSKTVISYLKKTHLNSKYAERWDIQTIALGNHNGIISFKNNDKIDSAFDGVSSDIEEHEGAYDEVRISKLDNALDNRKTAYSSVVIKVDVEGYELEVLKGAVEFIKANKPYIVIEIVADFLTKFNIKSTDYINFINEIGYAIYGLNTLNKINNDQELLLAMLKNLNFVLLPKK